MFLLLFSLGCPETFREVGAEWNPTCTVLPYPMSVGLEERLETLGDHRSYRMKVTLYPEGYGSALDSDSTTHISDSTPNLSNAYTELTASYYWDVLLDDETHAQTLNWTPVPSPNELDKLMGLKDFFIEAQGFHISAFKTPDTAPPPLIDFNLPEEYTRFDRISGTCKWGTSEGRFRMTHESPECSHTSPSFALSGLLASLLFIKLRSR